VLTAWQEAKGPFASGLAAKRSGPAPLLSLLRKSAMKPRVRSRTHLAKSVD
jgi:hypothetical protein